MSSESLKDDETRPKYRTAGIIIIGDEVLKGQVVDINSHFLSKQLYSLGVKLGRISVIPDDLGDISTEIRQFSSKYDFVLTTGGVGPTHDDITYVGVAQAFGEPIVTNPQMAEMIEKWLGHKGYSRDVIMKMAQMPETAKLFFDPNLPNYSSFPIVVVHNVYIFPGIPQYLQRMFPRLESLLRSNKDDVQFHSRVVYVARDEMSITPQLNEAVAKYKTVIFGSYPVIDNLYYSTRLTMESTSAEQAEEAQSFLADKLPEGSLIDYDSQPLETAADKVYAIVSDETHPLHVPVRTAVEVRGHVISLVFLSTGK
jgi:FAD synthetase